jgi:hypothetical protein
MPKSSKKRKEDSLPQIGETFPPIKDPLPAMWIPPPPALGERVIY